MKKPHLIRLMAPAIGIALSSASVAKPSWAHLGYLGSDSPSLALDVSANGLAVVGFSNSAMGFEAFRWKAGTGMVGLGDLAGGAFSSQANACSGDGSIVFGSSDDGSAGEGGAAFRWTLAGGMVAIGSLGGPTTYGQVLACSGDGAIAVGQSQSPSGVEAFAWTQQTGMTGLGDLPGGTFFSSAAGVSDDGTVVCGTGTASTGQQPFRWTSATGMTSIDSAGAGLGISSNGQVIVGSSRGNAVRWTPQGKQVLFQTQAFTNSYAFSCSADGNVVVGLANYSANMNSGEAFIWDPILGARSLKLYLTSNGFNVSHFDFLAARAVSSDGKVIVGYGDFGTGQEAWIVNLRTLSIASSGMHK